MKCDRRLLSAYRDGALKPAQAAEVEEHLSRCADCRAALAIYQRIGQDIRGLSWQQPPSSLRYRVFSELPVQEEARSQAGRPFLARLWKPLLEVGSLALVTIGLIVLFTTVFNDVDNAPQVFAMAPFDQQTNVPPGSNIEVQFSHEVDKQTVESAVRIEPQVEASFTWQGNTLVIVPKDELEISTSYTVTIEPGVKDNRGKTMKAPLVFHFTTATPGQPIWQTDRIGFLRRGDLWTMATDGSAQKRLTEDGSVRAEAWSPDGKTVAFLAQTQAGTELKVMDNQGKNSQMLAKDVKSFRWSQDSKHLVYTNQTSGSSDTTDISVVEVGSGTTKRVTVTGLSGFPDLSPDGLWLAYAETGSEQGIWVADVNGKTRQRIAAAGSSPVWSPDGKTVAYMLSGAAQSTDDAVDRQAGVFVASANGEGMRRLTGDGQNLRWSPDGQWLLFDRLDGNRNSIWVLRVSDGAEQKLTEGSGAVWSSDSRMIALEETDTSLPAGTPASGATTKAPSSIAILGLEDGKQQSLVADATSPSWIHDGTSVSGPAAGNTPTPTMTGPTPGVKTPTPKPPTATPTPKPVVTPLPTGKPLRWVAVDQQDSATIYVMAEDHSLYRSRDAGATWQAIGAGLPAEGFDVTEMVIDPQKPDVLYLAGKQGLYRSSDGGENWSSIGRSLSDSNSKTDAANVVALTLDPSNRSTLYVALDDGRLYKTIDAGATWQKISSPLRGGKKVLSLTVHPQKGTVYLGSDEGIWISADGGGTWKNADASSQMGSVLTFAFDPSSMAMYAGTQAKGVFKSTDGGNTWKQSDWGTANATVRRLAAAPKLVCALTGPGGANVASSVVCSSEDSSGASASSVVGGAVPGSAGQTIFALALTKDGKALYIATHDGLFRSSDRGQTWQPVSVEVAARVTPTPVAAVEITGTVTSVSTSLRTIDIRADDGSVWTIALDLLEKNTTISFPNGAAATLEDVGEGQRLSAAGTVGAQRQTLLARSIRLIASATPTPTAPAPTSTPEKSPTGPPPPSPSPPASASPTPAITVSPSPTVTVSPSPTATPTAGHGRINPRTESITPTAGS